MVVAGSVAAREYARFDVVGDSDSRGVNPELETHYGWVHMLFGEGGGDLPEPSTRTLQSLWPGIEMRNSAVSGSTAAQWQDDALSPSLQDVMDRGPDLVAVMIGGNDFLAYFLSDGEFSESEQELYRTHLTAIIDRLQAGNPRPDILLLNYYDLADNQSGWLQLVPGYSIYAGLSQDVIVATNIIREVAEAKGCYHIDIYTEFMYHCYGIDINGFSRHDEPDYVKRPLDLLDLTTGDIHPVTAGYRAIHLKVYEQLKLLKAINDAVPETWLETAQQVAISSTGSFYAMIFDFGASEIATSLNGVIGADLAYDLPMASWLGAYLYDYETGAYSQALYIFRDVMQ